MVKWDDVLIAELLSVIFDRPPNRAQRKSMKRHPIDLSRWRARIASWQKHAAPFRGFGDKQNIALLTKGVWSRISKLIVPAIQSLIIIFF
jgi:hypothetical protein